MFRVLVWYHDVLRFAIFEEVLSWERVQRMREEGYYVDISHGTIEASLEKAQELRDLGVRVDFKQIPK